MRSPQRPPCARASSTKSHVIRLHEHSTTSRNAAIPTITIQSLKQPPENYVRNWWALRNSCETAASRSTDSSLHSAVGKSPHRPHHKNPPHRLRSTDPGATTPTHSALHPRFPRLVPGADTPRGRPGGRPLGASHQHSASCPRRLLNNVSSALLGPGPCRIPL